MSTKRVSYRRGIQNRSGESGQTTIFVVLVLGLFLLAVAGLAIDFSNVYFRRQAAQGAADAACQAGAMDMLVLAQGEAVPAAGFTVGLNFDCTGSPAAVPCQYALRNGYDGTTGLVADTESKAVSVSFPGGVTGVTTPPVAIAGEHPFMRVDVTDRTRMYFSSLLTKQRTKDVPAHAVCGLQEAQAPVPIIVLHPTCPHAFQIGGSAHLAIIGGPNRSVQVNSDNTSSSCATAGSESSNQCGSGSLSASCPCASCQVDLCRGGPNFTGSGFGTYGAAGDPSATFAGGSTGSWNSPTTPIPDPFARTDPPPEPALSFTNAGPVTNVPKGTDGCPDPGKCVEYYPGKYTNPIVVNGKTAIFVPGIYYMTAAASSARYKGKPGCNLRDPTSGDAALAVESNGVVRPADCRNGGSCSADGLTHNSGGTMFYFTNNSGGAAIIQNAGARTSACCGAPGLVDKFDTSLATCPGGTPPDNRLGLPALVDGNVLMGQCTNDGTYTTGAATGDIRGLLFFQDRAISDLQKQSSFQGTGSLLLAGTIYAHNSSSYRDFIQLQGTPGSGTFILGEIVTDQLVLSGNGSISMQLNPNAVYHILKVALLE